LFDMTSLETLPAFLAYFAGSLILLGIFLWLHKVLLISAEWRLIREGNAAAALSVAGAAAGFALPLASAIVHSAGFADMVIWAVISGVVQFGCFAAMRFLRADVAGALARGDIAEATMIAAFSLILGILNAACLS
jgi:putative membrane protein